MTESNPRAGRQLHHRLLVVGYYGYGNVGDEAILRSLLRDLGRELPEAEFLVLHGAANEAVSPPAISGRWPAHPQSRVRYLPRLQPSAILAAMRESDMLVLGGGTLIQDVTSLRSLAYYLALIWTARRAGLPVAIYGGGIGPLTTSLGRQLAARVLPAVNLMALRDRRSINTARSLGVSADRLLLTADPAFSRTETEMTTADAGQADHAATAALAAAGVPADRSGGLMALALRPPLSADDRAAVIEGIRRAATETGLFPLFVPFHPEHDLPLLSELGRQLGMPHAVLRNASDPVLLQHIVSRASLMVAMRLHGVIFAVAAGVPCVAMAYDPKVDALADDVPALRYARYPGVDPLQLAAQMREAAGGGEALAGELRRCADALGIRAAANATAVAGLLKGMAASAAPAREGD